jgi:hypothetical protein
LFGASTTTNFGFNSSNQLLLTLSGTAAVTTTAVYRDPAAWYHLVYVQNGAAQTIYVNGASAGTGTTANTVFNTAIAHQLAAANTTGYFDGEMAEINFVDGQALAPTSFGATGANSQWLPVKYAGTYGTNGFYLPFSGGTTTVSATYLVVAGGGGAGASGAGGGGAGGYRTGTLSLSSANTYTATVGAGGAGTSTSVGVAGSNSVFSSITSAGGGYGAGGGGGPGGVGGSAGGSGNGDATETVASPVGQGSNGRGGGGAIQYGGGGGGGASAQGATGGSTTVANPSGGAGLANSISGSSVTYAGGGGGGYQNQSLTVPGGGAGGGGNGATSALAATAGTANLGGGGGGGGSTGGAGGSGVVIISYAGAQVFTGGTVTTSGGNTIHTFTSSGFLTGIFNDQSGNGNNWTPNNISLTAGSTYDSLTDVPTLTSATVANYAVLNPLNVGGSPTLSNGNLTIPWGTSLTGNVLSTIPINSGKWYWEIGFSASLSGCAAGIASSGFSNSTLSPQSAAPPYAHTLTTAGVLWDNDSPTNYFTAFTASDILGIKLDYTNGTVYFYKNNTLVTTSSIETSQLWYPIFYKTTTVSASQNINFGQQPFVYTPPTGFLALNTYNLAAGTVTTSGTFTGNLSTDGPMVWLNGTPTAMTINGNAVTFGTQADKLANGFKVRSSSASYNASGSNTYVATTVGAVFKYEDAQGNP